MSKSDLLAAPVGVDYFEIRQHEVRKTRIVMVDGNLVLNSETNESGTSARVFDKGYWGFSSVPVIDPFSTARVSQKAADNASAMCRFGDRPKRQIPLDAYSGEHRFEGKAPISLQESAELLKELNALCNKKYSNLRSVSFFLSDEAHSKTYATSNGGEGLNSINRAVCIVVFTIDDQHGHPIELDKVFSCKGSLIDLGLSLEMLEPHLEELYQHLQAKRVAVPPKGGEQTIILSPELAGMLAHEAMGHPCEADFVLGGAATGNLVGKPVASELITMVDFAHTYEEEEVMIPVYADDEGTAASDAVLIEKGIMRDFMTSRETAARLGIKSTGNARAYMFSDEPLVRMRNTAILPGTSKLNEMIAGVEEGYYLLKTRNGEADSTTEFMFGINLAYEIKNGKLGSAITNTTVSGRAIDMLKTVDAVSDDMYWCCSGYCGKKQLMVVSMGGPALRAKIHVGGE